jgi:carboxypeptidase T
MKSDILKISMVFSMLLTIPIILPTTALNIENTNLVYEYYNYQKMTELLQNLQSQNSDIMKLESYGKTYEGREIWLVKISDNVNLDEKEPGVLFMGAHHGNEKPSYEALLFFIKYVLDNYTKENRVRNVVDNTQIFVIPMVNPDGVEYSLNTEEWRKNREPNYDDSGNIISFGVDLNRNYDFKWDFLKIFPSLYGGRWIASPDSFGYRGEAPFSENETTAVKNFVEQHLINISLSYHTYGEFITYPWTDNSGRTPDEELFVSVGEGICSINNYELYGTRNTMIPRPGGTLGTSENWLYGTQGILSFTIEICNTRTPTNPATVYQYCSTHVKVNLYVCERAADIMNDGPPKDTQCSSTFPNLLTLFHQFLNCVPNP